MSDSVEIVFCGGADLGTHQPGAYAGLQAEPEIAPGKWACVLSEAMSQQDKEIAVFARETPAGPSARQRMTLGPAVKEHINELYEQARLGHRKL